MTVLDYIKTLSQAQRSVVGITLSTVLILFVAHNPLSGYTTTKEINWSTPLEECNDHDRQEYRKQLEAEYNDKHSANRWQWEIAEGEGSDGVARLLERKLKNCWRYPIVASVMLTDQRYEPHSGKEDLPFNEWTTDGALVYWLGPLVNFLYAMLTTLGIGSIFTFLVFTKPTIPPLSD